MYLRYRPAILARYDRAAAGIKRAGDAVDIVESAAGVAEWFRSHRQDDRKSSRFISETRMRRMRRDDFSRRLMRETQLTVDSLIYPMFVVEGSDSAQPIVSMPGIERLSVDELLRECATLDAVAHPGHRAVSGHSAEKKSLDARESWNPGGHRPARRYAPSKRNFRSSASSPTWRSIPSPPTARTV